mmetsp:Transcript_51891/g.123501  ORF Transcript_51891/g.123501 Transcript_51891/m.123501 type:complete len:646 (+) Transcript_51891:117-2054(+)
MRKSSQDAFFHLQAFASRAWLLVVVALNLHGHLATSAAAESSMPVSEALIMADIGHSREQANALVSPWPMAKCAVDGSFSLYEGMLEFVRRQKHLGNALPQSVYILGDIAYCGGDAACLNGTRDAFQKYLDAEIAVDSVFPVIGNHDVHYYGCAFPETRMFSDTECHYGTSLHGLRSAYSMSFEQWRSHWFQAFPGIGESIVLPPPSSDPTKTSEWIAPLRYNIDPGKQSKVYFIVGLLSGAFATSWNGDTPPAAVDSMNIKSQRDQTECRFLRDSLAHGRRLGKRVFIYLTHHVKEGCTDWSILQQLDIWIYGHRHNAWQSVPHGAAVTQEQRHYPLKFLIGNGGFDEAYIDVVNFVRYREEHVSNGSTSRILLHFEALDTCKSKPGTCPSSSIHPLASCWSDCVDVPGGYDGGSGPRAATPSSHGFGFTYDAPMHVEADDNNLLSSVPGSPSTQWKVMLKSADQSGWLGLGACNVQDPSEVCIVLSSTVEGAATFSFYDSVLTEHLPHGQASLRTRIAIWEKKRGFLTMKGAGNTRWFARSAYGFWDEHNEGIGLMLPSDGHEFVFEQDAAGKWYVNGLRWSRHWPGVCMFEDFLLQLCAAPTGLSRETCPYAAAYLEMQDNASPTEVHFQKTSILAESMITI